MKRYNLKNSFQSSTSFAHVFLRFQSLNTSLQFAKIQVIITICLYDLAAPRRFVLYLIIWVLRLRKEKDFLFDIVDESKPIGGHRDIRGVECCAHVTWKMDFLRGHYWRTVEDQKESQDPWGSSHWVRLICLCKTFVHSDCMAWAVRGYFFVLGFFLVHPALWVFFTLL